MKCRHAVDFDSLQVRAFTIGETAYYEVRFDCRHCGRVHELFRCACGCGHGSQGMPRGGRTNTLRCPVCVCGKRWQRVRRHLAPTAFHD